MSLNIKNENVHEAVRELARLLDVSQTSAVEVAVRAKLAELDAERGRIERERRIRAAVAELQDSFRGGDFDAWRATEDLYDAQTGLPR